MEPECGLWDDECWQAYADRASADDDLTMLLWVGGIIVAVILVRVLWSFRKEARPAASTADLRPLIETHSLPFSVCTQCRILIELEHGFACPQCGSLADCVRVERDEERSMACAAVELPPD